MHLEVRSLQSRNAMLESKLAKFERDARYMQSQEDQLKKRERDMAAQVRQKDEKLRAVKEIFERSPMVHIQVQNATPRKQNQESGIGSVTSTGFASRTNNRTALYPQLPVFSAVPLRAPASAGPDRRRAPSPPPKSYRIPNTPMGTRTLNRVNQVKNRGRGHRRSKSVDAGHEAVGALSTLKSTDEDTSENNGGQKRKSDEVDDEEHAAEPGTSSQVTGILKKGKY